MAKLEGQTIAASYDQLLHVDTEGGGATTTLVPIKDGNNDTTFCLQLATTSALIVDDAKLYFGTGSDASIEYDEDGADNLSIAGSDVSIADGIGLIVGNTAQVAMGEVTSEVQILGTTETDASLAIGLWSTTDALSPSLKFVKGAHATIGNHSVTVEDNEELGKIQAYGSDATDSDTLSSEIAFNIDDDGVGTGTLGGEILLKTSGKDGTLDTAVTIDSSQNVALAGGLTTGTVIASAYLDADTAHLSGSQTFTGNKTFTLSGDHLEVELDADGSSSHSPHLIFAKGGAQKWKLYREYSADGLHTYSVSGTQHVLSMMPSGFVGIGDSSPGAHLDIEDLTIDTTSDYLGLFINHKKTDGASGTGNDYTGMKNQMEFSDGDASHGTVKGFHNLAKSNTSTGEGAEVIGIYNSAQFDAGDVNNVYSIYNLCDVNGGKVDAHVYGMYISTDVESESTIDGDVTSLAIIHNDDGAAGSNSIGIYQNLGATTDWGYFQDDESDTAIKWTRDGTGYWDGVADTSNADYAEYFESTDGSVIPIGNTVVLENGKIRQAGADETPIGIIRPHSAVAYLGNSSWSKWQEKYIKDDYGAKIMESFTKTKWSEEITFEEYIARGKDETGGSMGGKVKDEKVEGSKAIPAKDAVIQQKTVDEEVEEEVTTTEVVLEDGKYVQKTTTETVTKTVKVPQYDEEDLYDEDGEVIGKHQVPIMETVEEAVAAVDAVPDTYFREHKYHSDRLPEGVTAPDDAKVLENAKYKRKKLNLDYDESLEYETREERDEWHIVGLLGQIPITKGQPTGNWIKMKDVSDTVEMYFVK